MRRSLATLLLLAACSPAASPTVSRDTSPTQSPASSAADRPAPRPDLTWRATGSVPDILVVNHGGRIEVRDARGRFVRVLVEKTDTGRVPLYLGLTLSPDRRTVYFTRYVSDSCREIATIPVSGGRLSVVARGGSVSISPDGRFLAYSDNYNCGARRSRAVVRDLADGSERIWRDDSELGGGGVAWLRDSRYLIFESCGADSCGPRVIDTKSMTMTDRRPYVLPSYIDYMNAFVTLPVLRGNLDAAALHVQYSSEDGTEPHPVLLYDFETRRTTSLFARGKNVRSFEFDRTGYHLLYVTADHRLFHYDGDDVTLLGADITGAVW